MIIGAHRFHGHNSLRFVYTEGKTVRGAMLSVRSVENKKRRNYRCAVVVSKKVSKSAVIRNRIRRRIYEIVRNEVPKNAEPVDFVITVFSDQVAVVPHIELQQSLRKLLSQSGVVK